MKFKVNNPGLNACPSALRSRTDSKFIHMWTELLPMLVKDYYN